MTRTIILAAASLAALTASTVAFADDHDKVSRSELRHDQRRVAEEQSDLATAYKVGNKDNIADQKRDLASAKRELREDRHDAYRAGIYRHPRGYRMHNWGVGERLPASYYGRSYRVDSHRYGLPTAGRGERWVRVDRDVVRISPNGTVREVRHTWFR